MCCHPEASSSIHSSSPRSQGDTQLVRVGGACGPPPPVAAPLASSLRAPFRGDPPLKNIVAGTLQRRGQLPALPPASLTLGAVVGRGRRLAPALTRHASGHGAAARVWPRRCGLPATMFLSGGS